jgi:hypothetical protein
MGKQTRGKKRKTSWTRLGVYWRRNIFWMTAPTWTLMCWVQPHTDTGINKSVNTSACEICKIRCFITIKVSSFASLKFLDVIQRLSNKVESVFAVVSWPTANRSPSGDQAAHKAAPWQRSLFLR